MESIDFHMSGFLWSVSLRPVQGTWIPMFDINVIWTIFSIRKWMKMDYMIYSKMDYLLESMENNEFLFQLAICKMIQWRIILKNPYIYIYILILILWKIL